MQDLRVYTLVHKRLVGDISDEELQELKILQLDGDNRQIIEEVETVWTGSKDYFPQRTFDAAAAKAKFKKNNGLSSTSTNSSSSISDSSAWRRYVLIILGLLALGSIAYLGYKATSEEPEIIEAREELQYALLKDDTKVWMSKGGEIDITNFGEDNRRMVSLDGEAYFEVVSDDTKPFIIDMQNGNMLQVVGTSFNVNTNAAPNTASIVVVEGVVRLYSATDPSRSIQLIAGETASVNFSDNTEVQKHHTTRIQTVKGTSLSYKATPLNKVFDDMRHEYEVSIDIAVGTSISDCRFTSPMLSDVSLSQLVELLTATYENLSIDQNGNALKVSGSCE